MLVMLLRLLRHRQDSSLSPQPAARAAQRYRLQLVFAGAPAAGIVAGAASTSEEGGIRAHGESASQSLRGARRNTACNTVDALRAAIGPLPVLLVATHGHR